MKLMRRDGEPYIVCDHCGSPIFENIKDYEWAAIRKIYREKDTDWFCIKCDPVRNKEQWIEFVDTVNELYLPHVPKKDKVDGIS